MWTAIRTEHHGIQVVPNGDICGHSLDRLCLCVPSKLFHPNELDLTGGDWAVVHNAWDGREARERYEDNALFDDGLSDTLSVWVEGGMV